MTESSIVKIQLPISGKMAETLTSEELSDLFDEISQVIVGTLYFVLGGCCFVESCLCFPLRFLCLGFRFCHLRETQNSLQESLKVFVFALGT